MGNYKLSTEAENDLKRIWLYGLKEFGEVQADLYFFKFFERFEQLAEQPYSSPSIDEIRQGYRRAVCGIDSIYYRINDNTIEIMRILGRQDRELVRTFI